ncbi:MAG: hypothetical protein AUI14_14415 [Actinobacteria bacterium 13_2_20CM_2_71_6]|nr:MAG: hypothetical protein AUI14_14415 [Actinobacteria bacterium 13_2_20CM_2_71_6]
MSAALPAGASSTTAMSTAANTATASQPAAASNGDCDRGPWQDRVQGRPAGFDAGDKGGDYLWHDTDGFHLRVTHKGDDRAVYAGVIHSPTPMRIEPVHLEGGDVAQLSADHRTLTFRFADYGHIDGVDFHTDCAPRLRVADLTVGGQPLPANRVYLGADRAHPASVPFTLHRDR